jgi:hypothetical protein
LVGGELRSKCPGWTLDEEVQLANVGDPLLGVSRQKETERTEEQGAHGLLREIAPSGDGDIPGGVADRPDFAIERQMPVLIVDQPVFVHVNGAVDREAQGGQWRVPGVSRHVRRKDPPPLGCA